MSGCSYACNFTETVFREADDQGRIVLVGYSDPRGTTTLYRRRIDCAPTWPDCPCSHCEALAAWRAELGMGEVRP
ncbi:hypothetical protein [Vulgatibacter sp.]|uniref:hypothetical protein n=1 Tax=Vulgatibacter sp. TaxID=1971226 RepID=UPI0035614B5D